MVNCAMASETFSPVGTLRSLVARSAIGPFRRERMQSKAIGLNPYTWGSRSWTTGRPLSGLHAWCSSSFLCVCPPCMPKWTVIRFCLYFFRFLWPVTSQAKTQEDSPWSLAALDLQPSHQQGDFMQSRRLQWRAQIGSLWWISDLGHFQNMPYDMRQPSSRRIVVTACGEITRCCRTQSVSGI